MPHGQPDSPADAGAEKAFLIELWLPDASEVEKVLGRAASEELARAIFEAAAAKFRDRRITLRHGNQLLAESTPKQ